MIRLHNGVVRVDAPCPANALRIDQGAMPMVMEMNQRGILISPARFADLDADLARKEAANLAAIESLVGQPVNPNSGDQISRLLFAELGLESPLGPRMTKKRTRPACDDDILASLLSAHPVVPLIRAGRELTKLRSTYTSKLPLMASPDGRIRTTLRMNVARTGRLSSEEPNLQNIPVATEDGRRIRGCFVARPGCVLGAIDLSQIEMVWAAELSADPTMREVYALGQDLHVRTACALFQLDYSRITGLWKSYKAGELTGLDLDEARHFELNQRLPAKCFHPDTEVLTRAGWKPIMRLGRGEEVIQAIPSDGGHVSLEWAVPTEVYSTRHPSGKLMHLKNQGMDLRVTPDHRMLGLTGYGKHKVVPAAEFASRGDLEYWHNSGILATPSTTVADGRLLRLAVALQADGSITQWKSIRFGFSRDSKAARLRALLQDAGIAYRESLHHNGHNGYVKAFSIHKGDAAPILALLDSDKTLPWWWLDLPMALRSLVLDEVGNWDSCRVDRRYMYSSRKKKNIDVLQALAAVTGRKARAGELAGPDYTLSIPDHEHGKSRTGNLNSTELIYTDDVACLSVPSTYVLVRDRGVTVICGQTLGFAVLYGVTPSGLQAQILAAGGPLLTVDECEAYIHAWYASFRGVRLWMELQHSRAQRYGMNWTAFGRPRLISEAMSAVPRVRAGGLRQSGNHPIQGSSGDQLKLGMAAILPLVDYYRSFGPSIVCDPLLQIHDELIFELTPDIAQDFLLDCNQILTTCVRPMAVPVRASTVVAGDWGGLK